MSRRPFFVGLTAVLAVVLIGIAVQAAFDAEKQSAPPHQARPVAAPTGPPPLAAVGADTPAGVVGDITTWIEGVVRHEQEVAEAERLAAARSAPTQRVAGGGTGPASCDGIQWAIPVGLVIRESGCNFDAQSPSSYCGGYGCVGAYQFDSRHWDPNSGWGGCADLEGGWTVPENQHECARRLSRDSTNLSPWGG